MRTKKKLMRTNRDECERFVRWRKRRARSGKEGERERGRDCDERV